MDETGFLIALKAKSLVAGTQWHIDAQGCIRTQAEQCPIEYMAEMPAGSIQRAAEKMPLSGLARRIIMDAADNEHDDPEYVMWFGAEHVAQVAAARAQLKQLLPGE